MNSLSDFHFLRPLWLWALPLGAWFCWYVWRRMQQGGSWRAACDPSLLPHLVIGAHRARRRWPLAVMLTAVALTSIALAGPAWRHVEQPVYRSLDARVIVLDLSTSMNAPDLPPSRLTRARFKVVEILRRSRDRQTGLVAFAGDAFFVSPLTQDANTLINLLPSLRSAVMPVQGSRPDRGLEIARQMLAQGGAVSGDVVLVTDGTKGERAARRARELLDDGFRVSVLAVGTREGAPIPLASGGFLKNLKGEIVVPGTDFDALRAIASAGGGRFSPMTADESDLDQLLAGISSTGFAMQTELADRTTGQWHDEGPWLVLIVLPLVALAFRRGWLLTLGTVVILLPRPSLAVDWEGLWYRADQRAARALIDDDPERAADVAPDFHWRGSALYRAQQFEEASEAFAEGDDAQAHYNRGNALARAGRLRAAVSAYEKALAREPGHEDAEHNRALVEALIERLPKRQQRRGGASNEEQRSEQGDSSQQAGSERREDEQGSPGAGGERGGRGAPPLTGDNEAGPAPDGSAKAVADLRDGEESSESPPDSNSDPESLQTARSTLEDLSREERQAIEQWLRRVPDDPGGLLRRKFERQYQLRGRGEPARSDAW